MLSGVLKRLWTDEDGFIISLELTLTATMLLLGMVVGMQVLRDAAAQELADLGMAIGAINNSYVFTGVSFSTGGSIAGSSFTDATDLNDDPFPTAGVVAGGLMLGQGPTAGG